MKEFEITNEMLKKAEESLYNMEISAKLMFDELFPNLDFEKDFLANERLTDIEYLFEIVEKACEERGFERYGDLYKLLDWTYEGLVNELFRERDIETTRNFDENEVTEFISWLQEQGLSYEEAQNPDYQIEMLNCFLNEVFRERDIETIRNFDENELAEFISWLQERGHSYEEAQDPEIQVLSLSAFLDERRGY